MQSLMSFIVWTLGALIVAWFLTLGINRTLFYHTNIDPLVQDSIRIADTDIGTQCEVDDSMVFQAL